MWVASVSIIFFLRLCEVLFPNSAGRFCFNQHWRAREAEILVLSARAHEKILRARRVEVLADTTLCKARSLSQGGSDTEHSIEDRLCRIEVLRMFRQNIRRLCANSESCPRVCLERPIDLILELIAVRSSWHPDQLHLAEWQALQQLEFIFNVTLSVDGKNMALAKLAKHKGLSHIDAEMSLEPGCVPAQKVFDVEDVGGVFEEDDAPDEEVGAAGVRPPCLSEEEILSFLRRDAEIQLAKQPGQGRREGLQNMRQVDAAFGDGLRLMQSNIEHRECSRFGAAEHSLQSALEHQKAQLAFLREQETILPGGCLVEQRVELLNDLSVSGVKLLDDCDLDLTENTSPVIFA